MTGFASLTREDQRATVGVTIRAVNHRYLDVQLRLPQSLWAAKRRCGALLQRHVARGRIELSVSVQLREPPAPEVELHGEFVRRLGDAIERARQAGLVSGQLTPGDLVRIPQALVFKERAADAPEIDRGAGAAGRIGGRGDGVRPRPDAPARRRSPAGRPRRRDAMPLAVMIERLAAAAAAGRVDLETRLAERVRELSRDLPADPAAIAQEIVRTAARSDISEEVTRFRAHLAHWTALTGSAEPSGRKFDFLLQEMNREINTIGSKADGLAVTELIVNAKAELEKMREQVQNVE